MNFIALSGAAESTTLWTCRPTAQKPARTMATSPAGLRPTRQTEVALSSKEPTHIQQLLPQSATDHMGWVFQPGCGQNPRVNLSRLCVSKRINTDSRDKGNPAVWDRSTSNDNAKLSGRMEKLFPRFGRMPGRPASVVGQAPPAFRSESGMSGTPVQPSAGDAGPYQYPSLTSFGFVKYCPCHSRPALFGPDSPGF
jgi:hypothetical protein